MRIRFITRNLKLLFLLVSAIPMLALAQGQLYFTSQESSGGKIDVTIGYQGDRDSIKYSIAYEDNQGNVPYQRYVSGGFSMDKRPAVLMVDVYWQDDVVASAEAIYYGFAKSAISTTYLPDGTVNAPNIIPALPTNAMVAYASGAADAAPTNSIDTSTGVITITGVTNQDLYVAYFRMPEAAGYDPGDTNILNTYGDDGYELGTFTLKVDKRDISDCTVSLNPDRYSYYGSSYTPHVDVKVGTYYFKEGANEDYTVSSNPREIKDAGDYTITITPTSSGRLTGSAVTKTFTMEPRSFETDQIQVTLGSSSMEYNGSELHPTVSVAFPSPQGGYDPPIDASNYTVSYANATNVGTATVTVTGTGNYTGSASAQFTITAKSLSGAKFSDIPNQTYTGNSITPEPTVTLESATNASTTTLVKGTDFDFSYANNVNVPTTTNAPPTVTITGKGNYTGTASKTFIIVKATPTVTAPTGKSLTYTGSAQALVNAGSTTGGTLQYSLDGQTYGTAIPTGKDVGTYTVYYRVEGDGNYNSVAAKSVTATIAVSQSAVATAPTAKTGLVYTGSAQNLINAGTATNGVMQYSKDGQSFSTTIPTGINAGSYDVWYKVKGNTGYDDVAAVKITASIAKAAGSISYTTASISKTYGDAAFTNALTKTGDGTVSYSSSNTSVATVNFTSGKVTIKDNGTATITATVKDGTNYTYATKTAKYTLSVGTAAMDVSATGYTGVYDGNAHGISVSAPSGATVKYGESAGSYDLASSPAYTDAGTYTVYYEVTKSGYTTVTGSQIVTINKANAKVQYVEKEFKAKIGEPFEAPQVILDPVDLVVTYSSSDVDVATVDAQTGEVSLVAPGQVTITATFAGNVNYNSASDFYVLEVLQRDIEPIEEDVVYTMDEDDFFFINEDGDKEEVKLDNTVIYDILFTLDIIGDPSETDGYDETEHCIVLNHPMSKNDIDYNIFNSIEPGTDKYAELYTGLTFKVPAGKGYVIIDSQTDGDYQMMVKIGYLEPVAFNHTSREKDSVLYECSEPTWVYVYNGGEVGNARMTNLHRSKKDRGHVKIYSITRSSSGGTGIDRINIEGVEEAERWYDLQGNRINRPMKKGVYILRGKKVIVR